MFFFEVCNTILYTIYSFVLRCSPRHSCEIHTEAGNLFCSQGLVFVWIIMKMPFVGHKWLNTINFSWFSLHRRYSCHQMIKRITFMCGIYETYLILLSTWKSNGCKIDIWLSPTWARKFSNKTLLVNLRNHKAQCDSWGILLSFEALSTCRPYVIGRFAYE